MIFLVIVLLSPNGLIGLWEMLIAKLRTSRPDDTTRERGPPS